MLPSARIEHGVNFTASFSTFLVSFRPFFLAGALGMLRAPLHPVTCMVFLPFC
jgi:hypothetical protein